MAKRSQRSRGVPDAKTMARLQTRYANALVASGSLPPPVIRKLRLMQEQSAKLFGGPPSPGEADVKAMDKLAELAGELLPYLHFKVDDVDWSHPDAM